MQNEWEEDFDANGSENIEEREEDYCSAQNDTNSCTDECFENRQEQYVAHRKHKNKIIDSYY